MILKLTVHLDFLNSPINDVQVNVDLEKPFNFSEVFLLPLSPLFIETETETSDESLIQASNFFKELLREPLFKISDSHTNYISFIANPKTFSVAKFENSYYFVNDLMKILEIDPSLNYIITLSKRGTFTIWTYFILIFLLFRQSVSSKIFDSLR